MDELEEQVQQLPVKKIKQILKDPEKTAKAVNLVYVNDKQPGIQRVRKGKSFTYQYQNRSLKDKEHIARIKALVIPPAWEDVWICISANGHLQATGLDIKKRKQYKYHKLWNLLRNQTKFFRLLEFGKVLPSIRTQLEKD